MSLFLKVPARFPHLQMVVCLSFLATFVGCQGRGVELVAVHGKVTINGAAPPSGGTLFFAPVIEAGVKSRPGRAEFGPEGTFRAGTFDDGINGLLPGRYQVAVHCWEIPPSIDGPAAKSFVPLRYTAAATSKLELVVESGRASMNWNVELTRD